ncbi:MAG: hypothetical protein ACPGFC_06240, partial [Paracoccaceae bacterium]
MRRTLLIAASTLALMLPVQGATAPYGLAGAYLAARQATQSYDYDIASAYYARAVHLAPDRPDLLERATLVHLALGDVDTAVRFAQTLTQGDSDSSQIANLVMAIHLGATGDFDTLAQRLDSGISSGPVSSDLLRGWARLGAGDQAGADHAFDTLAQDSMMRPFALYNKALARSVAGNDAGALATLNTPDLGPLARSNRAIRLRAELMVRTGDKVGARGLLTPFLTARTPDPAMVALAQHIDAGEALPPSDITTVADGMAEVFLTLAEALRSEGDPDFLLLYARAATHLRPDMPEALLFAASLLGAPAASAQTDARLAQVLASDHRSPAFAARDVYRHPAETLKFFG